MISSGGIEPPPVSSTKSSPQEITFTIKNGINNGITGSIIQVMGLAWGCVSIWMQLIMEKQSRFGMSIKKQTQKKKMNILNSFYL